MGVEGFPPVGPPVTARASVLCFGLNVRVRLHAAVKSATGILLWCPLKFREMGGRWRSPGKDARSWMTLYSDTLIQIYSR